MHASDETEIDYPNLTILTLAVKPLIIPLDSSPKREDYNKNQKHQVGEVIQSS